MGNIIESPQINNPVFTKSKTSQSIENYVESLAMEKGENPSPQEKEVYEKVILTILDEINKVKF